MRRALMAVVLLAAVGALAGRAASSSVTEIAPGSPVRPVEGDTIRLLPGSHPGFQISEPSVTVVGAPGAVVRGPVIVRADEVTVRGLRVEGGDSGIAVEDAEGVVLEGLAITGAELHGIEVEDASAHITGCRVSGLIDPLAQGIEIRNASGRPRTVVENCTVRGGKEGIITHSARVEIRDNRVSASTTRAIAISEMSEGVMEGNTVRGVTGVGLYCGDMSHCEIVGNDVRGVGDDGSGALSRSGFGAVGWYHSTLRLRDNVFSDTEAGTLRLTLGSITTDRFPLSIWGAGLRGLLPGILVSALSLLLLVGVRLAVGPLVRRRAALALPPEIVRAGAIAILLYGFAVQSFHMLEHAVQVVQIYALDAEQRAGLLGRWIDVEWVHFVYNVTVLAFMWWTWRLVRPGGAEHRRVGAAGPWVLAGVVIQAYHLLEHTAKMVQHLAWGVKTAPGLLGGPIGLVWFHYGINLAVYAAMAVPVAVLVRSWLGESSRPGHLLPAPA
jgi:nitrous oxidase accessory protein NosD